MMIDGLGNVHRISQDLISDTHLNSPSLVFRLFFSRTYPLQGQT